MYIARTIAECRAARASLAGTLGFVPTMGYLHEGHLSLMRQAQAENDHVAVSIFVNPTQFNDAQDLDAYPRDEAHDLALLTDLHIDLVFIPPYSEIYPAGFQTFVTVEHISQRLEGAHRPDHFRGVATVVTKLFNIMQPDNAYFGQKDAQQVAVIRQLVRDLNLPLTMRVGPTVREPDGLAMSSRNARLSPPQRQAATILHQALLTARSLYENGERNADALRQAMQATLAAEPLAQPDYVSIGDGHTLDELTGDVSPPVCFSLAVFIGNIRLIDNLLIK
ncbi:MAG: pantoate--beta-alanine ligase [Anaerolineales bacterium]